MMCKRLLSAYANWQQESVIPLILSSDQMAIKSFNDIKFGRAVHTLLMPCQSVFILSKPRQSQGKQKWKTLEVFYLLL